MRMVTLLNLMQWEPNLWNNVALPDGVVLQTLVDTIVSEFGNMDVVHHYPDMFMWMNETWFRRKYWSIEKMYKTLLFDYIPIENYRRHEDEWENNNDVENRDITENREKGVQLTDNLSTHEDVDDTGTYRDNVDFSSTKDSTLKRDRDTKEITDDSVNKDITTSGTTTVNAEVSAYNSSSYVNDSKTLTETSGNEHDTVTEKKTVTGIEDVSDVGKDIQKDDTITTGNKTDRRIQNGTQNRNSNENENEETVRGDKFSSDRERKRGMLAYGNIGVTTTQQMIKEEREVSEFDFYWWLADMWARDNIVLCSI